MVLCHFSGHLTKKEKIKLVKFKHGIEDIKRPKAIEEYTHKWMNSFKEIVMADAYKELKKEEKKIKK